MMAMLGSFIAARTFASRSKRARRSGSCASAAGSTLMATSRERLASWAVAVGTAVARCPPHRPVLALLAHTVLTSDSGIFGAEAHVRVGLQDLDRWQQGIQAGFETLPAHAMTMASTPQHL